MLKIENLCVSYGDATALNDVSLTLGKGELLAVIGPNGAGKTTLVNTVARLLPVRSGKIFVDGEDVTQLDPRALSERRVALIPEGRRLFNGMTIEENLEMGCYRSSIRKSRGTGLEQVYAMFPILAQRRRQIAGTLSGGQQQMVAIARALMAQPQLLLIDEPSLGLAPIIISQVFDIIAQIHASGVSILLIEQNATRALEIAQTGCVIDCGALVAKGTPQELDARGDIRAAYLGHG